MTTSNPATAGLSAPVAELPIAEGQPSAMGLPSAEAMAQLANALFNALPGRPSVPGLAADAQAAPPSSALPVTPPLAPEGEFASQPVAPYVSPTSGFSPPSDAELRAAPASLSSVGGVPSPGTAAAPPDESLPYFLDPAQPGMPGTAVGLGPASATRIESGAMPTAPSPPSAFAQPAEPNLRSIPATAGGAAGIAPTTTTGKSTVLPFSFHPELVPATTTLGAGGSTPPTAISSADLPQSADSQPVDDTASIPTAAVPASNPLLPVSPPLPTAPAYYFVDEASVPNPTTGIGSFDPFGFADSATGAELGDFPFDSRLQTKPTLEASGLGSHQ